MTATKAPRVKKPTKKETERREAIEELRNILSPGNTIDIIIRRVSASGMSRLMSFHYFGTDGRRYNLTHAIATACDYRMKDGYLKADGCGMDMGFSVVYNLGRTLFPKGFGIEGRCIVGETDNTRETLRMRAKTKEEAETLVGDGWKFRGRNGDTSGWDDDGGYALEHRYL